MDPVARVLLVDDEPALLKMMSHYLGRLGFGVGTASTSEKAWEEVQSEPTRYSVAVLDATMDGIGLEDLARRMQIANPELCVIVASGYPVDMTAMDMPVPGRAMFLQKPFAPEMLAAAVRRMLGAQTTEV
jgi:DNA-binding NtrC family response regulator